MTFRSARLLGWCGAVTLLGVPLQAELSARMRSLIMAESPKFVPPPPEPPKEPGSSIGTPAPLSDDPLVKLPEYRVDESPLARTDPDRLLSGKGLQEKALADYRRSMTDLEWALNRWHIPLITPSAKARAMARYENLRIVRELVRLNDVAGSVGLVDPAGAKKLRRDLDLSRHPEK